MEIVDHGRGEEMQVVTGVDWNRYTKIILHSPRVEFREYWKRDQEKLLGKALREEDLDRIKAGVAGQFDKAMYKKLSEQGSYELISDGGPGVMRFLPNIVDLDVQAVGWVQNSIVESYPESRGSMRIELVIRDSETDELLAVAWKNQSDPQEGEMELTVNVSNAMAFRLMSRDFADWIVDQLEEARR